MKKTIIDRVKMLFETVSDETTTTENFKDIKTEDGRILRIEGDTVATEITVQEVTADGVIDLEDGDYVIVNDDETTSVITVASGIITEIKENPDAEDSTDSTTGPEETSEDMKTTFKAIAKFAYDNEKFAVIKQIYKYEITVDQEDFTIGTKVTMSYEYEDEMITYSAYAGTYELEDGRMITLNDEGVVVLITDKDGVVTEAPAVGDTTTESTTSETPTTEGDTEMEQTMSKVLDAFESLQEKYSNLVNEFEAFKKAPSATHTDLRISFNSEEDTKKLNRNKTPLDLLRGK